MTEIHIGAPRSGDDDFDMDELIADFVAAPRAKTEQTAVAEKDIEAKAFEDRVLEFGAVNPGHALETIYSRKPDQMGVSELFVIDLGGGEHLRWNDEASKFYTYTDGHWNEGGESHTAVARKVDLLGKRVTRLVDYDIAGMKEDLRSVKAGSTVKRTEGLSKDEAIEMLTGMIKSRPNWYMGYRTSANRNGIINFLKTAINQVSGSDLDADPHLLNFVNGTYDVRTGTLKPHDPNDYITHLIDRSLDMKLAQRPLDQVAPLFSRVMQRACAAEGEVTDEVRAQRVAAFRRGLGCTAHGSNPEKKMLVFKGASNTGKTVVANVIKATLGHQLATEAKPTLLIRTRNERHEAEEYKLKGRRLVLINELESKMSMDEGQVLRMINPSGAEVTVRKLREQQQDINLTWTIAVTTNELLKARVTPQVLNRLAIYCMSDISVPDEEIDPTLFDRIMEDEADAVLAHFVSWWRAWYEDMRDMRTGLIITDEMREAVASFKDDNAPSDRMFRDERTEDDPSSAVKAADIFSAFNLWLQSQRPETRREFEMGRTAFYRAVSDWDGVETVYEHKKGRRPVVKAFKGIRLTLVQESLADLSARAGN